MNKNPLMSVALHPSEDYLPYSGLRKAIERYEKIEINERFGLSLLEYLELPRDIVKMLTEISLEINKREKKIADDEEQKVNNELSNAGKK